MKSNLLNLSLILCLSIGLVACSSKSSKTDVVPQGNDAGLFRVVEAPLRTAVLSDKEEHSAILPTVELIPAAIPDVVENERSTFKGDLKAGKKMSRQGDYEEARIRLQRAVDAKAKSGSAHIELARVLIKLNKLTGARRHAELAIAILPHSSYGWNTMGRVELVEEQFEAAITSFQRAVDEDENNFYAQNNLALALMKAQKFEQAKMPLEIAVAHEHAKAYMFNNLGLVYERLGLEIDALKLFKQGKLQGSDTSRVNYDRLKEKMGFDDHGC